MKVEVYGLEELALTFETLGRTAKDVQKKALYSGAGVMKDALIKTIEALPEEHGFNKKDQLKNVVGSHDKADLISHVGIASFESSNGTWHTCISWDGYGSIPTKKYPNGRPVIMIARSINSGSSVRRKVPFIRNCANQHKQEVIDAMKKAADDEIKTILGGN